MKGGWGRVRPVHSNSCSNNNNRYYDYYNVIVNGIAAEQRVTARNGTLRLRQAVPGSGRAHFCRTDKLTMDRANGLKLHG